MADTRIPFTIVGVADFDLPIFVSSANVQSAEDPSDELLAEMNRLGSFTITGTVEADAQRNCPLCGITFHLIENHMQPVAVFETGHRIPICEACAESA